MSAQQEAPAPHQLPQQTRLILCLAALCAAVHPAHTPSPSSRQWHNTTALAWLRSVAKLVDIDTANLPGEVDVKLVRESAESQRSDWSPADTQRMGSVLVEASLAVEAEKAKANKEEALRYTPLCRSLAHRTLDILGLEPGQRLPVAERELGSTLFKALQAADKPDDKVESTRASHSQGWGGSLGRKLATGAGVIAGGVLIGVTGGLAAPAIAALLAPLGIGGLLAGGAAPVVLGTLFGVGGGGLAGKRVRERWRGVEEFGFLEVGAGTMATKEEVEEMAAARERYQARQKKEAEATAKDGASEKIGEEGAEGKKERKSSIDEGSKAEVDKAEEKEAVEVEKEVESERDALEEQLLHLHLDSNPAPSSPTASTRPRLDSAAPDESSIKAAKKPPSLTATIIVPGLLSVSPVEALIAWRAICSTAPTTTADDANAASANMEQWLGLQDGRDVYYLRFESGTMLKTGRDINSWALKKVKGKIKGEIIKRTVLNAYFAAVKLPMTVYSMASMSLDNTWMQATDRANKAGRILGEVLEKRVQGERPVILIGSSLGALTILKALIYLASLPSPEAGGSAVPQYVESAYLISLPSEPTADEWKNCRSVVGRRLVNAYSEADWVLASVVRLHEVISRAATLNSGLSPAGLAPVNQPGVEDVDVSSVLKGHMELQTKMADIIRIIDIDGAGHLLQRLRVQSDALTGLDCIYQRSISLPFQVLRIYITDVYYLFEILSLSVPTFSHPYLSSLSVMSTSHSAPSNLPQPHPTSPPPPAKRQHVSDSAKLPEAEPYSKAAVELYNTLEVMEKVLEHLDQDTLARFLRVEKTVTARVAAVLYRDIHISVASKMTRDDPRQTIYCDAVRSIDKSPPPQSKPDYSYGGSRSSKDFDPKALLKDIAAWRVQFPRLRTILHEYPVYEGGDSFVAHLCGESVHVEVQSEVKFDVKYLHFESFGYASSGEPELPSPPQHPGMTVRHTIVISVHTEIQSERYYSSDESEPPSDNPDDFVKEVKGWKKWLFLNKKLDKRVVGIDVEGVWPELEVSLKEYIDFLNMRRQRKCEPMQRVRLGCLIRKASLSPEWMGKFARNCLGPGLRSLRFRADYNDCSDWSAVIAALDHALPALQELEITDTGHSDGPSPSATPLSGMPNLRSFRFNSLNIRDPLAYAQYVHGLGSRGCTYMYAAPGMYSQPETAVAFNALVKKLKSSRPEYAYLRHANARDLDIYSISDVQDIVIGTEGLPRRIAHSKATAFGDLFSDNSTRFANLVDTHNTAAQGLQGVFAEIIKATEGAADQTVQANLIREQFSKVAGHTKEYQGAIRDVRELLQKMERAATDASLYTERWLRNRKDDIIIGKAGAMTAADLELWAMVED